MDLPDENNHNRLARALIERHGCSYEEALTMLDGFRLHLVGGEQLVNNRAYQAALLTAVNTGKRAFLGGVTVQMPRNMPSALPWPGNKRLDQIVEELGAQIVSEPPDATSQTLAIGGTLGDSGHDDLTVLASGWRGGLAPAQENFRLPPGPDHPVGGVLAGALGVARGFLRVSELSTRFVTSPVGYSLWEPGGNWLDDDAAGPELAYLPQHLWVLGLGHLGQAFLWNVGLLPFSTPSDLEMVLQDYDRIAPANRSAGLLYGEQPAGLLKTRLCAQWLEARGFATKLVERKFDQTLRLDGAEKFVAFCGFDKALPRTYLEMPGFKCIVECGLGSGADDFDQIDFHTFPSAAQSPESLWSAQDEVVGGVSDNLRRAYQRPDEPCGILGETLANKSLSSSFVGAFAGAVALGEVLRGLHGGGSCEAATFRLRSNSSPQTVTIPSRIMPLAECGFLNAHCSPQYI